MQKVVFILFSMFIVLSVDVDSFSQEQRKVKLPGQTLVVVRTTQAIDAEQYKVGSTVILDIAVDVKIDDQVLISAGTPVMAVMDQAETEGMVGSGGEIALSIQSTTAVDGTVVALTGNWRAKGEDEVGGTVAVGLILCPLALLNQGEPAIIIGGAQIRAFTIGEYKILPKLPSS
jgi:hypothetical protein